MQRSYSLPKADITHALIDDLVTGLRLIFGDSKVEAIYLGGSIATGDFDEATSDLDFLVVLQSTATGTEVSRLAQLHRNIRALNKNRLYHNYEGDYFSINQTLSPKTSDMTAPHLGTDGHFDVEEHGPGTIIDLWKIRHHGFTVLGHPPTKSIAELSVDDLVEANASLYKSWWEPKFHRGEPMDAEYQAYAVLTMTRLLYTLTNRTIASKKAAADWCSVKYPQFATLIARAREWVPEQELDRIHDVYKFIAFVGASVDKTSSSKDVA